MATARRAVARPPEFRATARSWSRAARPLHPGATIGRLQRELGNRGLQRLLQSGVVRAKLAIGSAGDASEREADRVADQVMRMPAPATAGNTLAAEIQRRCQDCESQDLRVQAARAGPGRLEAPEDVSSYLKGRVGRGRPLDPATRGGLEARFGYDFGRVRVHDDAAAAASAEAINARAYTFGHHIVFGAGQFAPGTSSGGRLLAHELTHVVQQNGPVVRRDEKPAPPSQAKAANLHFVIGDKSLDLGGGTFLAKLEDLRTELMKTTMSGGDWTLSITMHGAEKFFGLSGGDVTGGISPTDPRAYSETRVKQIFGEATFQAWRKAHGPKRINLLSCQVGPDLENTFLQLVQHPTSKQKAVGLGEGCLLRLTRVDTTVAVPGSGNVVPLKSRGQYQKAADPEKSRIDKALKELNDKYGYNGERIKEGAILDYYFDVAPEGAWLKLEVITPSGKQIPALNRQGNDVFIEECHPSKVERRPRQQRVPVPRDEQE